MVDADRSLVVAPVRVEMPCEKDWPGVRGHDSENAAIVGAAFETAVLALTRGEPVVAELTNKSSVASGDYHVGPLLLEAHSFPPRSGPLYVAAFMRDLRDCMANVGAAAPSDRPRASATLRTHRLPWRSWTTVSLECSRAAAADVCPTVLSVQLSGARVTGPAPYSPTK